MDTVLGALCDFSNAVICALNGLKMAEGRSG
jgi:hypothetical protein